MKPLSRRSVMTGLAAAVTALPMVASGAVVPKHNPKKAVDDLLAKLKAAYADLSPITPAEYLAEMEANGWVPVTWIRSDGRPAGVFEYHVSECPTPEDMEFLKYINHRIAKSGKDFYERTAEYLFEQGRGVPDTEFGKRGFRPKGREMRL